MDETTCRRLLGEVSLSSAIEGRWSVRRFLLEPLPREDVRAMVACATHAANAGNAQGWRFVAVEDAAVRCDMAAVVDAAVDEVAAWPECEGREADIKAIRAYATLFAGAPVVIAVFVLPYESRADALLELRGAPRERRDRLRQRPDLQSVGAAVQLLCTAAHAMGYGSCWMTAPVLAAPAIEELLGVEAPAHLAAVVPIGRPAGRPHHSPRRPVDDVLEFR